MRRDGTDVWVNDTCSNEEMNRYTCTVDEFFQEDPPKIDSVIVKGLSFTITEFFFSFCAPRYVVPPTIYILNYYALNIRPIRIIIILYRL